MREERRKRKKGEKEREDFEKTEIKKWSGGL
jgi:hypothetical protein